MCVTAVHVARKGAQARLRAENELKAHWEKLDDEEVDGDNTLGDFNRNPDYIDEKLLCDSVERRLVFTDGTLTTSTGNYDNMVVSDSLGVLKKTVCSNLGILTHKPIVATLELEQ